jgi:hypothetical protein
VTCHEDPDTAFPEFFSGGVEVKLADGRTLKRHVRVNSGAGERAMTREAVAAKFMSSANLAIAEDKAANIRDAVLDLENRDAASLAGLLRSDANEPR